MHMADALLSPATGGAMWVAAAGVMAYSARKLRREVEAEPEAGDRRVPLMGVLGAFVFAAQMINFTIPGTGASGHLGGGLLLAILLGPHAGLLTMASILVVQALFFADGGLLALGANIVNLGVGSCLIAYPLVYRQLVRSHERRGRILVGSLAAAVLGLQLGSLGVVLETVASGITELPWQGFMLLMQPVHLVIGIVEGLVTAGAVVFIARVQPELLAPARAPVPVRRLLVMMGAATLVIAAVLSWFASAYPDGLEWSMARVAGSEEITGNPEVVHEVLSEVQESAAIMPDYALPGASEAPGQAWPAIDQETSLAGVVGGLLTLVLVVAVALLLHRRTVPARHEADRSGAQP
jgi:cobalt/nickel transport system permease protein